MGHLHERSIRSLAANNKLNVDKNKEDTIICNACCKGKFHKLPHFSSPNIYSIPLSLIIAHIWNRHKYILYKGQDIL